jgi:hypothetical protein
VPLHLPPVVLATGLVVALCVAVVAQKIEIMLDF